MTKNLKTTVILSLFLCFLFSSCGSLSISRMRYSRGLNIGFVRYEDEASKEKKQSPKEKRTALAQNEHQLEEINSIPESVNLSELHDDELQGSTDLVSLNDKIQLPVSNKVNLKATNTTKAKTKLKTALKTIQEYTPLSFFSKKETVAKSNINEGSKSGVWGIVGFVFSILSLFVPILAILGLIFSAIGLGRDRNLKGLAIAGFVISLVMIFLLFLGILILSV